MLVAAYPIIAHLASNLGETQASLAVRPMLPSLGLAYLLLAVLWLAGGWAAGFDP